MATLSPNQPTFDAAKADSFTHQLFETLNGSAMAAGRSSTIALMLSISHFTHLFNTLTQLPPSTVGSAAQPGL